MSLPRCFLGITKDCARPMSGDHFMSAAVLRRISAERITIRGPYGERTLAVSSDALKTKRLCKRHNSALAPLDAEAGRLFQAMRDVNSTLAKNADPSQPLYMFSGIDIERWLLKTLVMVYWARVTNIQMTSHRLPGKLPYWLTDGIPRPYGLYFRVRTDLGEQTKHTAEHSTSVSLITHAGTVVGVDVELGGISFVLIVDGPTENFHTTHLYRPQYLNFFRGNRVISIALVWPDHQGGIVWLSHGDRFAEIPADPPQ